MIIFHSQQVETPLRTMDESLLFLLSCGMSESNLLLIPSSSNPQNNSRPQGSRSPAALKGGASRSIACPQLHAWLDPSKAFSRKALKHGGHVIGLLCERRTFPTVYQRYNLERLSESFVCVVISTECFQRKDLSVPEAALPYPGLDTQQTE